MLLLAIALLIAVFPIYWLIITSFKTSAEVYKKVPTFWPQTFTLEGYQKLAGDHFFRALGNSFVTALTVAAATLLLALPCSYALGRTKFRGSLTVSRSFLFAYLLPAAVMYLPMFIMLSQLGLSNSIRGLMLIYPTLTIPYATWMLVPYLGSIPRELEESAKVDGAGRLRTMVGVIFPLAKPGIVTTFIFCFTMCWGEYMYALVNISTTKYKTFPLVLAGLIKGDVYPWNEIMAGGVITCLPVILIYMVCSKYVIGGLTAGSVKG
ncbi:MAG: carbohydrate ABC transporter permease [Oscillospiraceae bacterium]|nr:carbohydrate ABC transporter permease [Oscillospiraceae bacterium]